MSIKSVIEMNDYGVQLLYDGHSPEAAVVFKRALKALLDASVHFGSDAVEKRNADKLIIRTISHRNDHQVYLKDVAFLCDQTSFFVFKKALTADTASNDNLRGDASRDQISTLLLYNLGLCFHLASAQKVICCQQEFFLKKALKLYCMASEVTNNLQGIGAGDILSLAIANNMGQIHSLFFEKEEVHHCLQSIRLGLDSCRADVFRGFESNQDYAIFYMNVLIGQESMMRAAPAA